MGALVELVAEGNATHEAVVGVHGDPEIQLAKDVDRVILYRGSHSGVNIRGGANLQGDSTVAHLLSQATKFVTAILEFDVVKDVNTVTEALGATNLDGFPN